MIPDSVQTRLLPLSAFMMGVVAVVVQWYGGSNLSKRWLGRQFGRAMALVVVSLVAFFIVSSFTVVQVEYLGGKETASFQVGFTRPLKPPCEDPDMSDEECIKRRTLNRDKIESFWGEKRVRTGGLALVGSYLLLTGSFAWLVGVLVLRDEMSERVGKKRKRAGTESPKGSDSPH